MKLVPAVFLASVALVMAALLVPTASACKCLPLSLQEHATAENLVQHRPVLVTLTDSRNFLVVSRVTEVFGGCLQVGDLFLLTTAGSSAACGKKFTVDQEYISAFDGKLNNGTGMLEARTGLCQLNADASELLADDVARRFLETRPIQCKGKFVGCAKGTRQANCFVDPCTIRTGCGASAAKCISNYCGGCSSEFYREDGRPTCFVCRDNFCGHFHTCNEDNICVSKNFNAVDMSLF